MHFVANKGRCRINNMLLLKKCLEWGEEYPYLCNVKRQKHQRRKTNCKDNFFHKYSLKHYNYENEQIFPRSFRGSAYALHC